MYIIKDRYSRDILKTFYSFKKAKQWCSENSYIMGNAILKSNYDVIILVAKI